MRHSLRVLLGLGLALGAAGCSDYLSGPGVSSTQDPNNPLSLKKAGPLYIGIQQGMPTQFEGQLARFAAEYTQQIAGISRQQLGFDRYQASPPDVDTYWDAVYGSSIFVTGGGGLLDIHKAEQIARSTNDSLYIGILKVYEALVVGYAAALFGDIPYREAADSTIPQPHFDPQLQVYGDLQAQLDSALNIYLPATGGPNFGPNRDVAELVYGGRGTAGLRAVYKEVAASLKARYFLHVGAASVAGRPGAPPAAYDSAFKYAQLGISTPDDDFFAFHDATGVGVNIWIQFYGARFGDIGPGAALVEIMKRMQANGFDDNQRLAYYWFPADGTGAPDDFFGYRPGGATGLTTTGGIYNGSGSALDGAYSDFGNASGGFFQGSGNVRNPLVSYAETQLIAAEAAWRLNGGGADPTVVVVAAQPFLDAARKNRHFGVEDGTPVTFGDAPGPLLASLQNIMEEKYIALFLNPEVWSDYRRTCLPSLAPAPAAGAITPGTSAIPGRLPYGQTEINANPNTPATSSAGVPITSNSINATELAPCPVLNYTTSVPLAN